MKFDETKIFLYEPNPLIMEEIYSQLMTAGVQFIRKCSEKVEIQEVINETKKSGVNFDIFIFSANVDLETLEEHFTLIRNDLNTLDSLVIVTGITEPINSELYDLILRHSVDGFLPNPFNVNKFLSMLSSTFRKQNPGEGIFFRVMPVGQTNVMRSPGEVHTPAIHEFSELKDYWVDQEKYKLHTIDFSDVRETEQVPLAMLRVMAQFYNRAKNKGQDIASINVGQALVNQITNHGLTRVFQVTRDLKTAKSNAGIKDDEKKNPLKSIDVRFVNPFLEATQRVLEQQANTKVDVEKPFVLEQGKDLKIEVGGVISIKTKTFKGTICLAFDCDTLTEVFKNMTGTDPKGMTELVNDCSGELLNIIHGTAKKDINDELGISLDIAIPKIYVGDRLVNFIKSQSLGVVLPFSSTSGKFYVYICGEQE